MLERQVAGREHADLVRPGGWCAGRGVMVDLPGVADGDTAVVGEDAADGTFTFRMSPPGRDLVGDSIVPYGTFKAPGFDDGSA
ncbi:hypothetical protein [Streptomyces cyanogenus]|uniref:hypothetical protein n=1 Tax=Streptomyces cyanogenus TaxID=80860 RepID=UPI001AA0C741|nr:hypothetical protein [Streptomyces cyanogenus]